MTMRVLTVRLGETFSVGDHRFTVSSIDCERRQVWITETATPDWVKSFLVGEYPNEIADGASAHVTRIGPSKARIGIDASPEVRIGRGA